MTHETRFGAFAFTMVLVAAACSATEQPVIPEPIPPTPIVTAKVPRGEVLTSKNDNARTGANLEEDVLDPTAVKRLALVARLQVDGELYAQPLVVGDVETPAGKKTLAIVAT